MFFLARSRDLVYILPWYNRIMILTKKYVQSGCAFWTVGATDSSILRGERKFILVVVVATAYRRSPSILPTKEPIPVQIVDAVLRNCANFSRNCLTPVEAATTKGRLKS